MNDYAVQCKAGRNMNDYAVQCKHIVMDCTKNFYAYQYLLLASVVAEQ